MINPLSSKPQQLRSAAAAAVKADRHFVTALGRGLEVLACFRHGDRMLGNQDLARACGLPKSTISRLTNTLTKLGYLVYVEDSAKYSLGTATLSLGSAMLSRLDIRKLAHPRDAGTGGIRPMHGEPRQPRPALDDCTSMRCAARRR